MGHFYSSTLPFNPRRVGTHVVRQPIDIGASGGITILRNQLSSNCQSEHAISFAVSRYRCDCFELVTTMKKQTKLNIVIDLAKVITAITGLVLALHFVGYI